MSLFQHDDSPPHNSMVVRNFLINTFPNPWIGRGGTIHWTPRFPDLVDDFLL